MYTIYIAYCIIYSYIQSAYYVYMHVVMKFQKKIINISVLLVVSTCFYFFLPGMFFMALQNIK